MHELRATYPLFETIKHENQETKRIDLHLDRIQRSSQVFFKKKCSFLSQIESTLDQIRLEGLHKVNVFYNETHLDIRVQPYTIPIISQLKLVSNDTIQYSLKCTDRSELLALKQQYSEIIICKEDNITDSSFSNLAFWDGRTWLTPATPLFNGLKRQVYLEQGILEERIISVQDIVQFEKISLINAMLDLHDVVLETNQIMF